LCKGEKEGAGSKATRKESIGGGRRELVADPSLFHEAPEQPAKSRKKSLIKKKKKGGGEWGAIIEG